MKRLIITTDTSAAGHLKVRRIADLVLPLEFDHIWGRLQQPLDYNKLFAHRSAEHMEFEHWLDFTNLPQFRSKQIESIDLALLEMCKRYRRIDLWVDPGPNDQLMLIGLLDHLHPHQEITSTLTLLQSPWRIGSCAPEVSAKWRLPRDRISQEHLDLATAAWRAFCAPSPQKWFDLMSTDTGALPKLQQAGQELLEELPMRSTGLGATEMTILKLIAKGGAKPLDVFPGWRRANKRRVFEYWDVGRLLDRLAKGPSPAVAGLQESPFTLELLEDEERCRRYDQSKLSLTSLGEAILAQKEDFSRHNPIDRWWGGTHLTNDNLWRWDPGERKLLAPQESRS